MSASFRQACFWVHRYTGLLMAGFLVLTSVTGILLVWRDPIDDWANRDFLRVSAPADAQTLSVFELHDRVRSAFPDKAFSQLPLDPIVADKAVVFRVDRQRGKPASKEVAPKNVFQMVYVNPVSGAIIATRDVDAWQGRNVMTKVFWLHRNLLLGDAGKFVLGVIALIWTINCFIGVYLTFPRPTKKKAVKKGVVEAGAKKKPSFLKRWRPAWTIRFNANAFKLNYDLHQATGLWFWAMLFVLAWSSVGFNLPSVYNPVMNAVFGQANANAKPKPESKQGNRSAKTQNPEQAKSLPDPAIIPPETAYQTLQILAQEQAQKQQVKIEVFNSFVVPNLNKPDQPKTYAIRFITNKDIGLRGSSVSIDATTGKLVESKFGHEISTRQKAGNWLVALHRGFIGRNFVSATAYDLLLAFTGLVTFIGSVTGVYLFIKTHQRNKKSQNKKQKINQAQTDANN